MEKRARKLLTSERGATFFPNFPAALNCYDKI
ncbi:hypothetical protein SAMN05216313_112117 [Enterocloster lavalensis]|uniref:Uncharacterized protein n=1 Tax=Enterocloster lavalensis TaxID=460384 RepID=A0A1I0GP09_9FIRM|nr:hypothetical protein SAMN05216313_112117 [Enterocloster lavalensis]